MSMPEDDPAFAENPYDTPEYRAFLDDQAKHCHCARNQPCDGVLAGGPCDDIQESHIDDEPETV